MSEISLVAESAEEHVLGACLKSETSFMEVSGLGLRPEDFGSPVHEIIYDTIVELQNDGKRADATMVMAQLEAGDKLDLIGGVEVVERLEAVGEDTVYDAADHADIVLDRKLRRNVRDFISDAASKTRTIDNKRELLDSLERSFYKLVDSAGSGINAGISADELVKIYQTRTTAPEKVLFPYSMLNKHTRGREAGSLSIWGAYTGVGKTIMAMMNALNAAEAGHPVGYFSFEMTEEELLYRLLAMVSGIPKQVIEDGPVELASTERVEQAIEHIASLPLKLFFDPEFTVTEIKSIVRREELRLVEIDYLQRIDYGEFKELPRIAKHFKNMALTTGCSVDLLSQLTPKQVQGAQCPFTTPDTNSLYGGKAIAHEANHVIFLQPDYEFDKNKRKWEPQDTGTLMLEKNRGGTNGESPIGFDATRIMWTEVDDDS